MTSTQFLELVVSISVQIILVVSIAYWLGRLVNCERIRCRLWTVCNVSVLALLAIGLLFPHLRIFQPWSSVDLRNATAIVSLEKQIGYALFFVWIGGAALSLVVFVIRSFQAKKFLRECKEIDFEDFACLNGQDVPEISAISTQKLQLLTTSKLTSPFCYQFHRPYIVLPKYLLDVTAQELNYIIRHELEHLKTGHPLQLFLQRIVETIFWFHPMVWWASQQSAASREFVCDDAAIDSMSDISTYLRTLLMIVEHGASRANQSITPLAFGRGKNIVAKRAQRLVQIASFEQYNRKGVLSEFIASVSLVIATIIITFLWIPVDVLASSRTKWSPCPSWTASVLHDFGFPTRDFEIYDRRYESLGHQNAESSSDEVHGSDSN